MRLAERVATGDQRDRLLVVHRHPSERLPDVPGGSERVRFTVQTLRIHVDEAHLDGGEGRIHDAAKAIGGADNLRVAAIPTTLSGAEMTPFHRMPAGVEEFRMMRPQLVLAAPGLMASQKMPDLAASAMNALAHAVEALYTPMSNPVASWRRCGPPR